MPELTASGEAVWQRCFFLYLLACAEKSGLQGEMQSR